MKAASPRTRLGCGAPRHTEARSQLASRARQARRWIRGATARRTRRPHPKHITPRERSGNDEKLPRTRNSNSGRGDAEERPRGSWRVRSCMMRGLLERWRQPTQPKFVRDEAPRQRPSREGGGPMSVPTHGPFCRTRTHPMMCRECENAHLLLFVFLRKRRVPRASRLSLARALRRNSLRPTSGGGAFGKRRPVQRVDRTPPRWLYRPGAGCRAHAARGQDRGFPATKSQENPLPRCAAGPRRDDETKPSTFTAR